MTYKGGPRHGFLRPGYPTAEPQAKEWLLVEKATAAEGRGGYCWVPAGVKRNRVLGA